MLKKLLLVSSLLLGSLSAQAYYGEIPVQADLIPTKINSIHIYVSDLAKRSDCPYDFCFRMAVYLNGSDIPVARWMTSPGKKWRDSTGRQRGLTPEYTRRDMHPSHIYYEYFSSSYPKPNGGAPMPFAMFLRSDSRGKSPIAIHAGNATGDPESKGCLRLSLQNAETLNSWVREAGARNVTVTVRDTRFRSSI